MITFGVVGRNVASSRWNRLERLLVSLALATATIVGGCSSSEAPTTSLTLAPTYHLRSVDGVPVPITSSDGSSLDSGHVTRVGLDTIRVDHESHVPPSNGNSGLGIISVGTWRASQAGSVVVMSPLIARSVDTAFVDGGTLTLHDHSTPTLHVEIYVAP